MLNTVYYNTGEKKKKKKKGQPGMQCSGKLVLAAVCTLSVCVYRWMNKREPRCMCMYIHLYYTSISEIRRVLKPGAVEMIKGLGAMRKSRWGMTRLEKGKKKKFFDFIFFKTKIPPPLSFLAGAVRRSTPPPLLLPLHTDPSRSKSI
jgi:hypothetical protein